MWNVEICRVTMQVLMLSPYLSQDWYNIKLLKRDNANLNQRLSDSTPSSWTRRLYAASGIQGSKVSYMPRSSGARIAEVNNVPEAQFFSPQ
jgi:hypothetical protein